MLAAEVEEVLDDHPHIRDELDEKALSHLARVDVDRAVEIILEVGAKDNVRNPSAFVASSLSRFPKKRGRPDDVDAVVAAPDDVDAVLAAYPDMQLDEAACEKLRNADPERAVEIIEEVAAKGNVRNPSAFVASSLSKFPRKRGRPEIDVDACLAAHPDMDLDEAAHEKLKNADPARAVLNLVEIIGELAAKGDVRNPSAFIAASLSRFPHKRGAIEQSQRIERSMYAPTPVVEWRTPVTRRTPTMPLKRQSALDTILSSHRNIVLDEAALAHLYAVPEDRAIEIIQDILAKGDVRNPSAFVSQALRSHPAKRGGPDLEKTLAKYHRVAQDLDDKALDQLRRADPARAVEIIEDVATMSDVRNPSAFVAKALKTHPHKRGHEEMLAWSPHPMPMMSPHPAMMAWGPHPVMAWSPRPMPPLMNPKRARVAPGQVYRGGSSCWDQLDDEARYRLDVADPERAQEILEELENKGAEIRNPSAFVARALRQYPQARGRR